MSVIENINYRAGEFSLNIKEWTFPDEGLTLLCGPSGSGKTTLIRILCGLLPCLGFSWVFKGVNLAELSPPERHLGVLFQDLHLFPSMSVEENICFPLKARGESGKTAKTACHQMAEQLGLAGKLSSIPENLSGGEKQRVALAERLSLLPGFYFWMSLLSIWIQEQERMLYPLLLK